MNKIMSEDRTNMYELMNYWLSEIAPKYFDLEDLSLNRIGLFGYVNEIMAHSDEAIINENSILYNELFFKKAVLPPSIYSYASHYGVENLTAIPATMNFAIGISEQTLLNKSISNGKGNGLRSCYDFNDDIKYIGIILLFFRCSYCR